MKKGVFVKIKGALNIALDILLIIALIISVFSLAVNARVVFGTKKYILTSDEAKNLEGIDAVVILGCSVKPDKTLSVMLQDRVEKGIELYRNGISGKVLMSGDHSTKYYDEVGNMKDYAVRNGVDEEAVILDPDGLSSFESMLNVKNTFGYKKVVIVTQGYHLYRCVYIARKIGLDAYGVASDISDYSESTDAFNKNREFFARIKDYLCCLFNTKPQKEVNS